MLSKPSPNLVYINCYTCVCLHTANASESVLMESLSLIASSTSDDITHTHPLVLVCCLSNGTLLHISGVPFAALSGEGGGATLSPSLLQSLHIQKFATSFQSALKWLYLPSTLAAVACSRVLVIDCEGHLQALQLGRGDAAQETPGSGKDSPNFCALDIVTADSVSGASKENKPQSVTYVDMAILPCSTSGLVLLLTTTGVFQVLHVATLQIVQAFAAAGSALETGAGLSSMDQFVTMRCFDPPSPQQGSEGVEGGEMVLFSVGHVEAIGGDLCSVSTFALTLTPAPAPATPDTHTSSPSCASVVMVLLLDQSSLVGLNRCEGASSASTSPRCGSVFPIATCSGSSSSSVSSRLVRWSSASELSVFSWDTPLTLAHSDALHRAVTRVQEGQQLVWRQLRDPAASSSSPCGVLHTDCLSVIGYLTAMGCRGTLQQEQEQQLEQQQLSHLWDHVLDAMQVQSSLSLARLGLLVFPLTGGACSSLLQCAKVS